MLRKMISDDRQHIWLKYLCSAKTLPIRRESIQPVVQIFNVHISYRSICTVQHCVYAMSLHDTLYVQLPRGHSRFLSRGSLTVRTFDRVHAGRAQQMCWVVLTVERGLTNVDSAPLSSRPAVGVYATSSTAGPPRLLVLETLPWSSNSSVGPSPSVPPIPPEPITVTVLEGVAGQAEQRRGLRATPAP